MAFRYLIYSTGTTYSGTIVRESATNNPGVNEASLYSDFLIPEIQPLYLWRVTGGTNVVPNTDSNISNYENATAPPATPDDLVNLGQLTGATAEKITKVTGATNKVPIFTASGGLQSGGYTIPELTGLTTYTFAGSGGTIVNKVGNAVTIFSAPPTGSSVAWGSITGSLSNQTDLWADLVYLSGQTTGLTATKLNISTFNSYTGTTQPILNKALTGVTNLGSGTTLGGASARNATIKSISAVGGVKILPGDANNLIISGQTTAPTTWGNISGTLSNQTDLWYTLTGMTATTATKLNTSVFNTFTGTTLPANYYNKTQINSYTGQTNTLINSKIPKVTGATANDIATFAAGGVIQDSGKQFTTTVQSQGLATNNNVPTELAVRNAINQAITAAIILQGDWNATTNTPDLTVTGITTGFAWRVSVSGTTNLGGIDYWQVGDMAIKSASGWIRTVSEDISAIWGNISGTLSNQTDLQNALNAKLNVSTFNSYTGSTKPILDGAITGATNGLTKAQRQVKLGGSLIENTAINGLGLYDFDLNNVGGFGVSTSGGTVQMILDPIGIALEFSGTTVNLESNRGLEYGGNYSANYSARSLVDKGYVTGLTSALESQIDYISGVTDTKLNTSVFTGYTASTKNKDKKIQVVSTSTLNVNVVAPTGVTWNSANPYATDIYTWSGGTNIWIKSAGTYEIQYHALLKNDSANQTHSIGGYIVKNGSTLPVTATAAMVIGPNNSGELSLPPVVLTLAVNDWINLQLFRIGNAGTVNLINGSTNLMINKLT